MRLKVRFPKVDPNRYESPDTCPYGCGGQAYRRHGMKGERKALRDVGYDEVVSYRYTCEQCGRTFRVYPQGVSKGAQQSQRLRAMTVLLYVLGLSYGAVEDFVNALGCGVGKTTVYNNVQAAGREARRKQQACVQQGGKRAVIGADGTFVKVKGESVGIEVVVDDRTGELLGLDIITSENHEEVRQVIQEVADAVEPEVLVTDDHGAYTEVADELGLERQICRSHVKRNVDDIADSLNKHLAHPEPLPAGVELTPEQVQADLAELQRLVRERPPDGEEQLAQLYDRYKDVPKPENRQRHSVWYRMRMAVTRLWLHWWDLTLDQRRGDLDGTNNACERLIGWWIKERYRTMRNYKRTESIRNVVTLTALIGACPGYYDLAELLA
jgi:transposase-like protein